MSGTINNRTLESPRALLDTAYSTLDYDNGELLDASVLPKTEKNGDRIWLEKGDWLALATKVKAEKIFFVNNDPVIVFCQLQNNDKQQLLETYRQVWCMARPQCLFIATPGELKVYSLKHHPVRTLDEFENIKPLDIVRRAVEVSKILLGYRREQVETGQLFREKNFGQLDQRADKRLILDLKAVRHSLLSTEPQIDQRYVHALIGRSIFVRYLEDRGILIPEYFRKVAENKNLPKWSPEWRDVLERPEEHDLAPASEKRYYIRILRNKDLTYALFNQLTEHFNGDMFPRDSREEKEVTQTHLDKLRGFLLGDTDIGQQKLFLWAYDFEIIPIELISSIYEEFYHKSGENDKGTHYTPGALVEYVLSQVLTPQRLASKPKILDIACGSAIFLVQAFRRIVRYRESQLKRRLNPDELRKILREQITGIEINEEAVHIAAFSLYLALLHYQEPKSILAQIEQVNGEKPLPYLLYDESQPSDTTNYQILLHANSFCLTKSENGYIKRLLEEKPRFRGRIEFVRLYHSHKTLPFELNSFDIVVGNPPWGYLKKGEGTPELRAEKKHVLRWCKIFDWSIGDNELSQAFIARASSLLKPDGECGLLVSAGVFLKRHKNSHKFRQRWLAENTIQKVVNFTHVRHIFFSSAVSPFCFVQFKSKFADSTHRVQYWSAKRTKFVDQSQSVILSLSDIHQIRQTELVYNELLWKVFWWGNHRDAALINALNLEHSLCGLAKERRWSYGRGFEGDFEGGDHNPSDWLRNYQKVPTKAFYRYGSITRFEKVGDYVHRFGNPELYDGWRILVKRGITQAKGTNGRIEARLECKSYCFSHSIHGIRIDRAEDWERKVMIGILWSSLARYYFFVTAGSWGTWHHEINLEDGLMSLPIRFPDDFSLRRRIGEIVDKLRDWNSIERNLANPDGLHAEEIEEKRNALEHRLDEAIFELYELSEPERDLIRDMCEVGLEFFYREDNGKASKRVEEYPKSTGTIADLPADRLQERGLEGYLYAFLQMWNHELERLHGEFSWRIIRAPRSPMLAVVFTTQQIGEKLDKIPIDDEKEWQDLLVNLDKSSRYPVSHRIYIDGIIRSVTDTNAIIIKRNERRFWTRSLAREDAEATLLQAMTTQESVSQ